MTIGERLKIIRKDKNMTQQAFAEKLGLKQSTIAVYESSRDSIGQAVKRELYREFNVNPEWLETGEGEMYVTLTTTDQLAVFFGSVLADKDADIKRRFCAAFARLSPEQWEQVAEICETLIHNPIKKEQEE